MAVTPPENLDRYELLVQQLPRVAEAANAFADPVLRERAYFELLFLLNPREDLDTEADADGLARLAELVRSDVQPGETAIEATTRLLEELGRRRQENHQRLLAERWGGDGQGTYGALADPDGVGHLNVEYQDGGER